VVGEDGGSDAFGAALFPDRQEDAELRLGDTKLGKMLVETGCHACTDPHQGCTDPGSKQFIVHSLKYNSYKSNCQYGFEIWMRNE
jgi:hypothetical protein